MDKASNSGLQKTMFRPIWSPFKIPIFEILKNVPVVSGGSITESQLLPIDPRGSCKSAANRSAGGRTCSCDLQRLQNLWTHRKDYGYLWILWLSSLNTPISLQKMVQHGATPDVFQKKKNVNWDMGPEDLSVLPAPFEAVGWNVNQHLKGHSTNSWGSQRLRHSSEILDAIILDR